jgi:NADP-dependent aldehyde dehydrogenase
MEQSHTAFHQYKNVSFEKRFELANEIVKQLQSIQTGLIKIAASETNLNKQRLENELERTLLQFIQYSTAYSTGNWMLPRIDTGKKDVRKMYIPLGPVVVYGASNFPFAYATPGGDVASALAAGCTVVVKAHPAHPQTAALAAKAIQNAIQELNLHSGTFQQIELTDAAHGKALVQHSATAAVAFTGSYHGGKQLFDWANEREHPIPVFAEMGSVNPVFIAGVDTNNGIEQLAVKLSVSVSNSCGQFCTKPGIIIGLQNNGWTQFIHALQHQLSLKAPALLLHPGIHQQFIQGIQQVSGTPGVQPLLHTHFDTQSVQPVVFEVSATDFLNEKSLQEEVFGPYTLLVTCHSTDEMRAVAQSLKGQLTGAVISPDLHDAFLMELMDILQSKVGRLILNDVPTGVEVVTAMQHGGPFPATTDSRFTSVGPDSILRFVRPVTYQQVPNHLLPDALKNENPLNIWRIVNGCMKHDAL